jgi:hypothetical protein
VLDLAYNQLQGSLPPCLLNSLAELYLPGNALSGSLPAPAAASPLTTLYANGQRGGGLSGAWQGPCFAAVVMRVLCLCGIWVAGCVCTGGCARMSHSCSQCLTHTGAACRLTCFLLLLLLLLLLQAASLCRLAACAGCSSSTWPTTGWAGHCRGCRLA